MKISVLNPKHYQTVRNWWEFYKLPCPELKDMPETSFVIENDRLLGSASIIVTNSPIAWLEFVVANPDVKPKEKEKAIGTLIEYLGGYAKFLGKRILFCIPSEKNVMRRARQLGFRKTKDVIAMVKEL